jgi:hypothetical protein
VRDWRRDMNKKREAKASRRRGKGRSDTLNDLPLNQL